MSAQAQRSAEMQSGNPKFAKGRLDTLARLLLWRLQERNSLRHGQGESSAPWGKAVSEIICTSNRRGPVASVSSTPRCQHLARLGFKVSWWRDPHCVYVCSHHPLQTEGEQQEGPGAVWVHVSAKCVCLWHVWPGMYVCVRVVCTTVLCACTWQKDTSSLTAGWARGHRAEAASPSLGCWIRLHNFTS